MKEFFYSIYKRISMIIILAVVFTLTGCDSKQTTSEMETTIAVAKKGNVTHTIVESFSKDYYSKDDLETFFKEAISDYSVKDPNGKITLTELTIENQVAKAVLDFDSVGTYRNFYENDFFYGTLNEAYDAGYVMDVTLKAVDGSETITKAELMNMSKEKILITDEKLCVKTPTKIKYASANVEVISDKHVRISSDSSGLAYLILE